MWSVSAMSMNDAEPVWLVAEDGTRLAVWLYTSGGYDMTVLEGCLDGETPRGMFLGKKSGGDAMHDSECTWDLIDQRMDDPNEPWAAAIHLDKIFRLEKAENTDGWKGIKFQDDWDIDPNILAPRYTIQMIIDDPTLRDDLWTEWRVLNSDSAWIDALPADPPDLIAGSKEWEQCIAWHNNAEPATRPVIVLDDGETYAALDGVWLLNVPAGLGDDGEYVKANFKNGLPIADLIRDRGSHVIFMAIECAQFMDANSDIGLSDLVMVAPDTIMGFGDAITNIMRGLTDGMQFIRRADKK